MLAPPIHWLLETAAFTAGGLVYWRASNAASQPPDKWVRWGLLAGAAAGAALGSRLLYMLQYLGALAGAPLQVWFGGKTIVGGLLGAVIGVEVAKKLLGWERSTGDGFVLPLMVAIVIGRIGCQLAGLSDLTYGNPTSLPWGWDYGDGIARHPTALYEIAGIVVIAVLLRAVHFAHHSGDRFRLFMVAYLSLRLLLDFLKPPFGPSSPGLLSPGLWFLLTPIPWGCLVRLS
jgi:phosphatidylglycerol---prolipoprotein diacylglyceryl transferase